MRRDDEILDRFLQLPIFNMSPNSKSLCISYHVQPRTVCRVVEKEDSFVRRYRPPKIELPLLLTSETSQCPSQSQQKT